MVGFLTRHELRLLTRSAVVRTVLMVFGAAMVTATVLGVTRVARDQQLHDRFNARASGQRAGATALRAEAVANERGWLALLPPAPLAALASGQSDVYPASIKVTARNLDALVSGDQTEHPLAVASGHFDVAFVVLFLYPLLIFAISFDLTATERDRGTLRMVLAQPVRLVDVVAGKMMARWLLLAIPATLIPIVVIAATAQAVALRPLLGLWTPAVIAYGLIWHGIASIVNARGWNAAANALILAGIWLLFAIVGPATLNLLIDVRYPMPSRVEAAVQARAATQDATLQGSRQLGQFLQDHPTSANIGRDGMRQFAQLQAARDRQVAERMREVEQTFDRQLQRQQRLASWLSVLSPVMAAQGLLLDIAGTGRGRFEHFKSAAAEFHVAWKDYYQPRVLDAATLTPDEIASGPTFRYTDREATAADALPPIVAMAFIGGVAIWIGLRSYQGYAL